MTDDGAQLGYLLSEVRPGLSPGTPAPGLPYSAYRTSVACLVPRMAQQHPPKAKYRRDNASTCRAALRLERLQRGTETVAEAGHCNCDMQARGQSHWVGQPERATPAPGFRVAAGDQQGGPSLGGSIRRSTSPRRAPLQHPTESHWGSSGA